MTTAATDRPIRRSTRPPAKPQSAAKAVKPIRFESISEMCIGTNEEHIETVLGELVWMRAGIFMLNMNDRELEARIRGSSGDHEAQHGWLDLVEALTAIRDRYQAGIDLCNTACVRILHIFDRLQAETETASGGAR